MAANEKYIIKDEAKFCGRTEIVMCGPDINSVYNFSDFITYWQPKVVYADGTERVLTNTLADNQYLWSLFSVVDAISFEQYSNEIFINYGCKWNIEDGAGLADSYCFAMHSEAGSWIHFWGDDDQPTESYRSVRLQYAIISWEGK